MNAQTISIDSLPEWFNAAILLVGLPFAVGLVVAVFVLAISRWAATLAKIGSLVALVAAVLGAIDLKAARGVLLQLWVAVLALHTVFGQQVFRVLAANRISAASAVIGLAAGLVFGRSKFRRRRGDNEATSPYA